MTDDDIHTTMSRAREELARANARALDSAAIRARKGAMTAFVSAISRLGRWAVLRPELRVELQPFLDETATQLGWDTPWGPWLNVLRNYTEPLDFVWPELERALERRSDLQFVFDLYQGTAAEEELAKLEVDDIDEAIAKMADAIGRLPAVPADIPPNHVWWRWPDS